MSSATCDVTWLKECTLEEAATRMFVHALDGAQQGMKKILLRTLDTDVVVIGIHMVQKIDCECL